MRQIERIFVHCTASNQKWGVKELLEEFKAKGWLPGNADPSLKVSGVNAIGLFNSVTGDAE